MKRTVFIPMVLGLSVFALETMLVSCSGKKETAEAAKETVFTVSAATLSPVTLEDYIEFGGSVKAANSVALYPTVSGKIANILVDAGTKVSKNQVIAQVDASKPGAEFTMSPVRASAAGTVTAIPVSPGSFVISSTVIAEIASTENLEIVINVSERFVPFIKLNQEAEISFKAYPDRHFDAEIIKISPILDPATRTMQVTLKVGDTKDIIKSGMFAHVKLITQSRENVIAVPSKAIVLNNGRQFVFTANSEESEGGVYKTIRKPVTCGITVDGVTEITEGLFAGEKVIVKGQNMLSDGQTVNVIDFEGQF